jgi:hypothetical protein
MLMGIKHSPSSSRWADVERWDLRLTPDGCDGLLSKGTPMRPAHRPTHFLAAATAAALSLGGCAAGTSAGNGGPSTESAVQSAASASSAGAAPARASATTIPAATTTTPPPAPAGLVTFTFPDGRLSFDHPADWRVEVFEPSKTPYVGTATVYDASGNDVVNIYYGTIADIVAGSANRTVLETDPVPGLVGHFVPTPHSSFFVDRSDGAAHYRMGLTAGLPVSPDGKVQDGLIMLGDRVLTADVLFTDSPFANDEAAKDWYWGVEGRTLKAILMSVSYR